MTEGTSGAPLAVDRSGPDEGIPLLLLHGFPLDSRMWDDVVRALPDVPIVTVDAPGFGASPDYRKAAAAVGRGEEPSLETYADAVVASLLRYHVEHAVVVGLSMGGYVALALAERYPALLAGIGLLDTKASADPQQARTNRLAMADAAEGEQGSRAVAPMISTLLGSTSQSERPGLVEDMTRTLDAVPPAGIAWAQRAMAARPDRLSVLEEVDVPALVLRGSEDTLSTQESVEAMAHALRDCELVVVPSAGHMTALENPGPVADALRRLWERSQR